MTRGARRKEAEMRGKKVRKGGDESRGAELGTRGGEMRLDRRREAEGRIKGMEGGDTGRESHQGDSWVRKEVVERKRQRH